MNWKARLRDAFAAAGRDVSDAVMEELADHAADLERDARAAGRSEAETLKHIDEHTPIVRSIVAEVDPTLAVGRIATMEDRLVALLARPRLYSALMAAFAVLALSIASVGLFGVLSFSVAQRSRELAVRSALGASPGALLRLVLSQGIAVTLAGVVIGVILSLALAGTLRQWLYGLTGTEPLTYVGVAALMLAVASAACAAPALRAARLDPLVVLKRG